MTPIRRALVASAGAAGLLFASAGAASAHVTASPSVAPAGTSTVFNFVVGHGCDGSPTTTVAIQIPEGVTSVTPTVTAGWSIDVKKATLANPIDDGHGGKITDRVASVTYTATGDPLPDAYRQVFPVSMKMPDKPGETLALPVVQSCVEGETAWISVPKEGAAAPDNPAPVVHLIESAGDGHGDGSVGAGYDAGSATNAEDDESSNGLAIVALVVGALGLAVGGFAVSRTRR